MKVIIFIKSLLSVYHVVGGEGFLKSVLTILGNGCNHYLYFRVEETENDGDKERISILNDVMNQLHREKAQFPKPHSISTLKCSVLSFIENRDT